MVKSFYLFCSVVAGSNDLAAIDVSLLDVYGPVPQVSELLPWSKRRPAGALSSIRDSDRTSPVGFSAPATGRGIMNPDTPSPSLKDIPAVTIPEIPTVPAPTWGLPKIPTFAPIPLPKLPTLPTLPSFNFTIPTLPSLPTFPTMSHQSVRTLPDDVLCTQEIEILFVQDVSYGNAEIITEVGLSFLSELELTLSTRFAAARFSLVSFSDLYLITNPLEGDYCANPMMPKMGAHSSVMKLYQSLRTAHHPAIFANQLGALVAGLDTSVVQWSKNSNVVRVALVLTNTIPHFALDGYNVMRLPDFSESRASANLTGSCAQQYYPSPSQVRSAVYDSEVYVGFLVLSSLLDTYVSKNYVWMSNYLNQTNEFVQTVSPNVRDILAKVEAILSSVVEVECREITTTIPVTDTHLPSTAGTLPTLIPRPKTTTTTTTPPTTTTTTTTPPTTTTTTTTPPTTTTTTTAAPTTITVPTSTTIMSTAETITTTTTTTTTPTTFTTMMTTMPTTVSMWNTVSSKTMSTETSISSGDCQSHETESPEVCTNKKRCSTRCEPESGCCGDDDVVIKVKELPKRLQVVMDN